jgi:NitT/TauT family transport system ATP-binding protein
MRIVDTGIDHNAAPEDIRRDPRYLDTVDDIWTSLKGYLN